MSSPQTYQASLRYFDARKKALDSLFNMAESLTDEPLKNELARYICIRISGLIEQTVMSFYNEYAYSKGHPSLSRYVSRSIKLQNPGMKKLIDLSGNFNENWAAELDALDDSIKSAVDSIVAIRNQVAHGVNRGVRLSTVTNYYKEILQLLATIQRQCEL